MSNANSESKLIKTLKNFSRILPDWILTTKARGVLQLGNALLLQYGWLRSRREGKPVDAQGSPLPWITYPCIDFLKQLDFTERSVFEWGSGYSTLFWSKKAKRIVSVEADPSWYEIVKRTTPSNCDVRLTPRELHSYVGVIEESKDEFDVVSIDGPGDFRPACAHAAIKHLKRGGMILLDNSDQSLITAQILRNADLIQVDFTGFVPGVGYPHTTSIFFHRSYCFQPLDGVQPHPSVAQPNPPWPDA